MSKIKEFSLQLILIIVSVIVCLLLLEGFTRLIYDMPVSSHREFRMSQPEPYKSSPFFSSDFIEESFKQPGDWINPPGTRIIYPQNFNGKYFNVNDHLRVTTDGSENYDRILYVYGGSTLYGSEVPDAFTIPSFLQRKFNLAGKGNVRVVNCGVTSINTVQQLKKLEDTQLEPNDMVCFYGGVNDALLFTTGRIDGWIMGENYIEYTQKNRNILRKARFKIYTHLHAHSRFVSKFLDPFSYEVPEHLQDSSRIEELKRELMESYMNSIISADSICQVYDVQFFNFLQPNILSKANNSAYETTLLRNKYLIPPPFITALELSHPILRSASVKLREHDLKSYDLSAIFDDHQQEFYLDYCHVNEKANEIIAEEIFNFINN